VLRVQFKSPDSMTGTGQDENGTFQILGTYNEKAPYACDFSFTYSPPSTVKMEFSGWRELDRNGIIGQWKGTNGTGAFSFAPSKESQEAMKKMEESTKKETKTKLEAMGFPTTLIDEAMQQTQNLDEAIAWITDKFDSGPVEVDQEKVVELVGMGFEQEFAIQALQISKNDLQNATNWLLEQMS